MNAGTTIDTLTLNFGYFLTAQPLGLAVLNGVVRNATEVNSTTLTGGPTVTATGLGPIPALYAQAYTSCDRTAQRCDREQRSDRPVRWRSA